MTVFLDLDEDEDVIVSAIAESSDGSAVGDMHFPVSPGQAYQGIPYSVLKAACPGEYTLEELRSKSHRSSKERVA